MLVVSTILLFAGIVRNVKNIEREPSQPEKWMKLFYIIGLGILYISPWVTMIWSFPVNSAVNRLWAPAGCAVLIGLSILINKLKTIQEMKEPAVFNNMNFQAKKIGDLLDRFFRFGWLTSILSFIYRSTMGLSKIIITGLEGDGGLIWAVLFLVLLASVLYAGNIN